MATYVVGDIQGCFEPLQRLLELANFDATQDKIWFAGDLVNRGPNNLDVLRFIKNLGNQAVVVLGNHDLHLLAVANGARLLNRKDTLQDILNAPDREELLHWLRHRPLLHKEGKYVLSHAGVPQIWSANEAKTYANEVETVLQSDSYIEFLHNMYGDKPKRWKDSLTSWKRLRIITNYLTRMRLVNKEGRLDYDFKGPNDVPALGMWPWFSFTRKPEDEDVTFLFGHWATLEGNTGKNNFIALDTGCVWGGSLTMLRIDDHELLSVPANNHAQIKTSTPAYNTI